MFFKLGTKSGLVLIVDIDSGTKSLWKTKGIVLHIMKLYLDNGYHLFSDC